MTPSVATDDATGTTARVARTIARRASSERGSVLIFVAVSMTVLLAASGLFLSAAYGFDYRHRLGAAADAAAKAAAFELNAQGSALSNGALTAFGQQAMAMAGYSGATLTIRRCNDAGATCTAPYNTSTFVEAIVTDSIGAFFPGLLPANAMTVRARAVAGSLPGPNCIVLLGTASNSLTVANNAQIQMPGCGIQSSGGASIGGSANTIVNTNGASMHSGTCPGNLLNCTTGGPLATDPLAALPDYTGGSAPSPCIPLVVTAAQTISGGNYCGITFKNGADLTMNSGTYYMAGPITAQTPGATIAWRGSGVMIYLASPGGQVDIDSNHLTMDLSAPTSGTYKGILFFQARGNTNAANLAKNNSDNMTLSGALYFPSASIAVKNNNGTSSNDCTMIVAQSLDFENNSILSNACTGYGGSVIQTAALAE